MFALLVCLRSLPSFAAFDRFLNAAEQVRRIQPEASPLRRPTMDDSSHAQQSTFAIDELLDEIRSYLEAVELFRHEGCEPRWTSVVRPVDARV